MTSEALEVVGLNSLPAILADTVETAMSVFTVSTPINERKTTADNDRYLREVGATGR